MGLSERYLEQCMENVDVPNNGKFGFTQTEILGMVREHMAHVLDKYVQPVSCVGYAGKRRNYYEETKDTVLDSYVRYKSFCGIIHTFKDHHKAKGKSLVKTFGWYHLNILLLPSILYQPSSLVLTALFMFRSFSWHASGSF